MAGICTSLELAKRGFAVDLYDRNARPLCEASRVNEGKIHLGFVYAKDTTLNTVRLLQDGAMRFKTRLEAFVPDTAFQASAPFDYLVADDSLVSVNLIAEHFSKVQDIYNQKLCTSDSHNYLGSRPEQLSLPFGPPPSPAFFQTGKIVASCATKELAIDPDRLADALEDTAERSKYIQFYPCHEIESVNRSGSSFRVCGTSNSGSWFKSYNQVVNALWNSRLLIDASAGLPLPASWNFRLKLRVLCEPSDEAAFQSSYTMMHGPYGDLVRCADDRLYLSWYPSCMRGWSSELKPPDSWSKYYRQRMPRGEMKTIAGEILKQAGRDWMPALANLKPIDVLGGIICGSGTLDIDHHQSGLHQRDEAGVYSQGGFHSVNTGKYTLAPYLASEAAHRVAEFAGRGPESSLSWDG